jgi:hypothetical protein
LTNAARSPHALADALAVWWSEARVAPSIGSAVTPEWFSGFVAKFSAPVVT